MRVAVFSTKPYDREFLEAANAAGASRHAMTYLEPRLTAGSAPLAADHDAVCVFVNDIVDAEAVERLASCGVRLITLRCAGYNNVDLAAAAEHGLSVSRVPAYSPHAVAEHTVALMLSLNRKIYRAYARVREGNFALEGMLGFDMHGRTAGIVGTGKIGERVAHILHGFGCRLLAYDPYENPEVAALGARYVDLPDLFAGSDVITLHCPLTEATRHLINREALERMRDGVMLINTSRGALVDTPSVIDALKSGKVGYLGLDVYEEEGPLFFEDRSTRLIQDDVFSRLLTFPNVIITGHQAFFTREALSNIAETTITNITAFETGEGTLHAVHRAD